MIFFNSFLLFCFCLLDLRWNIFPFFDPTKVWTFFEEEGLQLNLVMALQYSVSAIVINNVYII